MTVFEVTVSERALHFEVAVIAKQFIARSDMNIIIIDIDAAQTTIGAATLKVNLAGIPIDMLQALLDFLFTVYIDSVFQLSG
jgi:hypothetical protein